MLVLSRKVGERIIIGDGIELVVVSMDRGKVRLGVVANQSVPVNRQEVLDAIQRDKEQQKGEVKSD